MSNTKCGLERTNNGSLEGLRSALFNRRGNYGEVLYTNTRVNCDFVSLLVLRIPQQSKNLTFHLNNASHLSFRDLFDGPVYFTKAAL